jgi:ABC-type glycerol-3-phosphate transport system substrate-binding protein
MEATLGDMGAVLQQMEDSIYRLNLIYRKILVLTGPNPDRFRDYKLEKVYPEVIEAMSLESKRLYKLVDDTVAITGQKSDRVAVAQTLAVQLENFVAHTERITQSFSNFKDNITSLGTAMQNMAETKLDVDLLVISGEKAALPKVRDGFLDRLSHEVRSAVASYFVDYNALGDTYDDNAENADKLIEVWITTGRDQSTVLKSMVDDTFTPATGIRVNVKLVVADTLLTAVVAGNGPDVVLSVGSWFPVNYAMRNAVEDLTQFSDYEQVVKPFYESALTSMRYNNGVYALPETQDFSVLFYRQDVLDELGLEVPETWDELIALLPTIQGNNLSVGIPYPDINTVDMSILNSLIYQNGGMIYDDQAMHTEIDSENGVAAFKLYTSLYNDYGLPIVYDFVSRFRTGEMPIGVANYAMYNTLAVSAPEIRGLWEFTYFPGTPRDAANAVNPGTGETAEDGINRTVHAQGLCCMIIAPQNDPNGERIKKDAWTFLQWWTDADTQVEFGREMESVLGSSARYTTANKRAIKELGWSDDQLAILEGQMSWTRGFPEIAGGYSTTRHMTNAIRKVINEKADARETLLTYTQTINEEIRIKRREFGLPTNQQELEEWLKTHNPATPAGSEAPGDQ